MPSKMYKTLEHQIQEFWASRGLEGLEERFDKVKGRDKTYRWTIMARERKNVQ